MASPARARILGDVGDNSADRWLWGKSCPDVALLVYGRSAAAVTELETQIKLLATLHGQDFLHQIDLKEIVRDKSEPFGFVDGISQPTIRGTYKGLRQSDPIHLVTPNSGCGWFLLGEDEFMPRILELQQDMLTRFELRGTVWHGLSSGGYAALKYCLRSPRDGLAFVVAPHNDPTILPQWEQEAVPYLGLPGWGEPAVTTDLLARWSAEKYLHAMLSEDEAYFGLTHLKPIMTALDGWENVRALVLRNGRGHGFISDADYETQLAAAIHDWEAHRGTPSPWKERSTACPTSR